MRNKGVLKILAISVVLAIVVSSVAVFSAANLGEGIEIGEKGIDEGGGEGVISLVPLPFIGVAGASGSASEVSSMREGTNFLEEDGLEIPNKILANFEDDYVDIWFGTKNMSAKETTETSYSEPHSMNITYTKLPCEESWNQSFGFELPSSLRDISNYSAISIRVNGSCSISAALGTGDSEGCVYLGTRSSTEPDTWNQLVWDLHAHDVNLSNVTCIAFVMDDEIGATRTFFLDDIELTKMDIPWSGLLANFEDNYVNFYIDEEPIMIAKKTSERYYSGPYSMNITYTKLPDEEGWPSFGFAFPSSLNLSNYSAISIRVNGSCSISALLYIPDQYVYLGLRSSTEPTTWNQLVWDLTATDVDLSNVTCITFVMDDEIGATRTFFLDDIELTKMKIPWSGLLANFENNYVNFYTDEEPRMISQKTSEISYSGPYSMNITYTKLPYEEGWPSFGFAFPSSLNLSNYSAISIRVNGTCSISALLSTSIPDQYVYLGLRSSAEPNTWNQLIWDLTATDVDILNVTGITFVMDDEIGTTRTFFLDDIELTKMVIPQSGLLANFEDNSVDLGFCNSGFSTNNLTAKKTSERSYSAPYSMNITYTKLPCEEGWQDFGFDFPSISLNLSDYSAISICVYGLCNISAYLSTTPGIWIGFSSSTEPDKWNKLIWDLRATDVDLSKVYAITFVIEDEIGVTRTFFLDDIELTTAAIYVPDDYPTIQDAVNAAHDGGTIIVRDGTYTENINVDKRLTIQSERDSTIVQAANPDDHIFEVTADYVNLSGFTVKGAGTCCCAGIYLGEVTHCNIFNNNASNNFIGIHVNGSSYSALTNNNVHNNYGFGICLSSSNNNVLASNSANNNYEGIYLYTSSDNTLTDNTMSGNDYNFVVLGWFFSHFIQNIDTSNKVNGKPIYYWIDKQNQQIPNDAGYVGIINSTNITVKDLTLTNNGQGVLFHYTSNSRIENVTASNNYHGIYLHDSSSNTLMNNTMAGNDYNFVIFGWSFGDFIQNIDTSNKVNGKPIYYWVDKQNQQIPNDAGYVGIINSTNITVKDLTLTNNGQGVLFAYTSNSRIENVTASNNYHGIYLEDSSGNTLTNNSADNNEGLGIVLDDSSDNTLTNNIANNNNL